MTVKGNGHVSLNGVRYLLDEGVENHYVHRIPGIFAHDETLIGASDKRQGHIKRLTWSMSDWSGGEGNRVFYDDQPNVYDYAVGINTRIPGQFTVRPKRDRSTLTIDSTDSTTNGHYPRFFEGAGKVWLFADTKVAYGDGTQATGWTGVSPTLEATNTFTAGCGDNEYVYLSAWKDNGSAVLGERTTMYSPDTGTTWRNLTTSETIDGTDTGEASKNAFFGMTIHNGRLFSWTGRKLFSYDIANLTGSNALASDQYRKVYDTGSEPAGRVFGNTFWGDIIDCGTSICFFASTPGKTQVYQYKGGVARPIWTKPGFTTKGIAYNGGSLYISGTFSTGASGGNTGHGALYMIPLDSLREIFLKWVRKTIDSNLQMQVASPSYGDSAIFCAAHTGRIWVYDADYNSFSMLDDLAGNDGTTQDTTVSTGSALVFTTNTYRIGDTISFGATRMVAVYKPGGTGETAVQVLHYYNDEPGKRPTTNTSVNWHLDSPEHDMGYPNDAKLLLGFHVSYLVENTSTTSGLIADQRIRIQYALDKGASPTWTTAATITSATALPVGGVQGRTYIDLTSSSLKFYRLRWRALIDNNNNASAGAVQPPIVLDVTAETELLAYDEYYDLLLRMKDQDGKTRVSGSAKAANVMRDVLITLRKNKTVFAFIDGYLYRENGRAASSVQVFIEELEDVIARNAEGTMRVRLRVVPV